MYFSIFHKISYQELPHSCVFSLLQSTAVGKTRGEKAFPIRSTLNWARKRWITEGQKRLLKDENHIPIQDTDGNRIHSLEWLRQTAYPQNTSRDKQWQHGTCAGFGGNGAPILHSQQEWTWHSSYLSTHFNLLTILREQSVKPAVLL